MDQARETNKKLRMQQAEIRNQRNNNNFRDGRSSGRGGYNNSNSNFYLKYYEYLFNIYFIGGRVVIKV